MLGDSTQDTFGSSSPLADIESSRAAEASGTDVFLSQSPRVNASVAPPPSSSTPILKVDTKGKGRATESDSSSSSDSDEADSPDRLSSASFDSTPEWMRPLDPSSSVSPPRADHLHARRPSGIDPGPSLSPNDERRVGEKNKRAIGDTGEWVPGQPLPDTWPDSPSAKRPLPSSRTGPRNTFPVGSPPRKEDIDPSVVSAAFSDFLPENGRLDWRGIQGTSPSARIRRPTSANFTPSVLSSAELESDSGDADLDYEEQPQSGGTSMPDPLMDALAAEVSRMLNFDSAMNTTDSHGQPIPVHTSDTYANADAIAALGSGLDDWFSSSSPGATAHPSLFQVPMYDLHDGGPLDDEPLEDYLSRTLQPSYPPLSASPWSSGDYLNLSANPAWDFADLSSSLPTFTPADDADTLMMPAQPDAIPDVRPYTEAEERVTGVAPPTSDFEFFMPFRMSSARSAAQAADLIAQMQESGMLAPQADTANVEGQLTADDLLLLDGMDFTTDEWSTWGSAAAELGATDPADMSNEPLFDFPVLANEPFELSAWDPPEMSGPMQHPGPLDAFDASFFGLNSHTFDWGAFEDSGINPVHRADDNNHVEREVS
ncbi:hypothetical protein HDZ31DRAFT_71768 [Schizophyllum fasciatum]